MWCPLSLSVPLQPNTAGRLLSVRQCAVLRAGGNLQSTAEAGEVTESELACLGCLFWVP